MEIADRIISTIHESYGQFLKWDPNYGWAQVDSDTAREKIGHFFCFNTAKISSTNSSTSSLLSSKLLSNSKTKNKSKNKKDFK